MLQSDFTVFVDRSVGLVGQKAIVAEFAASKLVLAEQINRSAFGYRVPYVKTVDGREGAALTSVNPNGGKIVFEFDIYAEMVKVVVEAALTALRDASPVSSGNYRASHMLFVNDQPLAEVPDTLQPTDRVMVANPVPYARRVEIGKTKAGRSFLLQVPNRIYERVAKNALAPRFGNQVKIKFEYVDLRTAYTVTGKMAAGTPHYAVGGRMRKRRSVAGSKVPSPAIIIGAIKN